MYIYDIHGYMCTSSYIPQNLRAKITIWTVFQTQHSYSCGYAWRRSLLDFIMFSAPAYFFTSSSETLMRDTRSFCPFVVTMKWTVRWEWRVTVIPLLRHIFADINRATSWWDSANTISPHLRKRGRWISWCRRYGHTETSSCRLTRMTSLSSRSIDPPHLTATSGPSACRPFSNHSKIRMPSLPVSANKSYIHLLFLKYIYENY